VLTSFTGANCYVVLERERGPVNPGEAVTVLPFDLFIS
jgi:molybdopterin biosynthesis enzyme